MCAKGKSGPGRVGTREAAGPGAQEAFGYAKLLLIASLSRERKRPEPMAALRETLLAKERDQGAPPGLGKELCSYRSTRASPSPHPKGNPCPPAGLEGEAIPVP